MEPPPSFQLKRKPVGGGEARSPSPLASYPLPAQAAHDAPPPYSETEAPHGRPEPSKTSRTAAEEDEEELEEKPPPLPARSRPHAPVEPDAMPSASSTWRSTSSIEKPGIIDAPVQQFPEVIGPGTGHPLSDLEVAREKPFWKTAMEETRHFAGGLIAHPTESTKHYSILRHSPAVVFYRGPETSVVISLLSSPDHPLPADRSLWLQQRGYSGDTGMKLKALVGSTSEWLEVTPSTMVQASDVDAVSERGWQRDIGKAVKHGSTAHLHIARETHVVRIPAAAPDGYFRVLLCSGRTTAIDLAAGPVKSTKGKVLCPSPLFRIASTSSDSSIFRGAKLRTVPLELGVMVASTIANKTIGNYVNPVTGAVTSAVQTRVDRLRPGFVAQTAGQLVYQNSGLEGRVTTAGDQYAQTRQAGYDLYLEEGFAGVTLGSVVGPEEGPQAPYPLKFYGKVGRGSGRDTEVLGIPTANLVDVPGDMRDRLKGLYFGWACVLPGSAVGPAISPDWHEALIIAAPAVSSKPSIVSRIGVHVYLLHDFGGTTFFDAKVKVMALGFLRPWHGPDTPVQAVRDRLAQDAQTVVNSLGREHWGPEVTLDKMSTAKRAQTLADRYADTRERIQKQVDRIPLHVAGVRTEGAQLRDKIHGQGGYWIPRSV